MGKKISELTNRQQLSGNEDLPFQEGQDNSSITIHSLNEYISNSNVNQAINQIKQAEQQAISNFSSQKVSPEMLSESTKQLINASGGGTITNLADDEDIESVGWDKAGDMTMPEFLNNADIVDMNCVFLNCRIGGTLVDTNWYKACYYNYNRTTTLGMRQYVMDAFNKRNIELRDIGNIINNRGNGSYKYTIYLLCGENIPIAKRVLNIDITDSDKEKTPYFYINPGKNYGFEIYRESPNGKKEVVVGFSSVNDVETLSFQDFSDCVLIGEHDSAWSSMKTSVLLWKPVKDDIPDKTLYPHFFYNQGVLVSTSGNLKSPLTDFLAIPYLNVGVTSQRPGNADNGFQFFDVTLRKPIWWNGSSWVDANGVSV